MKLATVAAMILAISMGQLTADADECNENEYQTLSLQGKIVRQDREVLNKTGEIQTVQVYLLEGQDSETELPVQRHCNGELKVDWQSHVGHSVTIAARGLRKPSDDGESLVYVHDVVGVSEQPEYESLNLEGKIFQDVKHRLDKTGDIKTSAVYYLETSDGKIELPVQSDSQDVDIRNRVGQDVTVSFRGLQKMSKAGKSLVYIHELVSVEDESSSTTANPFAAGI